MRLATVTTPGGTTAALWQTDALIEILGVAVIPDERLVRPHS